jgi:hypothetical protein
MDGKTNMTSPSLHKVHKMNAEYVVVLTLLLHLPQQQQQQQHV